MLQEERPDVGPDFVAMAEFDGDVAVERLDDGVDCCARNLDAQRGERANKVCVSVSVGHNQFFSC
jgi:hypothetical protein